MWHVYIIECRDGRLYTGITNDLPRRMSAHRKGTGAKFTRSFGMRRTVYSEDLPTKSAALRREIAIKRLTRQEKLILSEHRQETNKKL